MAWQQRGKCRYFYRAARVNGKVKTTYAGAGLAGVPAAMEVEERKLRRQRDRERIQEVQAEFRPLFQTLDEFSRELDRLLRAMLLTAGFHQHHRSDWRRRGTQQKQAI